MLKINTRRLMGSGGFHLGATTKAKRNFTIISVSSFVLFIVVSFCILRPLYAIPDKYHTNAATGTSTASESSITLASTVTDTSVVLTPGAGFTLSSASSTSSYDVTTNNYTGYTITLTSEDNDKTLVHTVDNTKVINSINTPIAETDFVSTTSGLMNHFGIKPNKYYDTENNTTVDNTTSSTILPAPGTTGLILDKTTTANSTANNYSIALGAMVDGTIPAGDYTRDTILTVIPNPIYYTINYDKNTDDTVTNLPTSQSANTTETSITLSSLVPVRTGYDFIGWCSEQPVDSVCSGTTYQPGGSYGIDQTTSNTVALRAIWKLKIYMQDITPATCPTTATTVYDSRDGTAYTIQKLADGKCWLLDNLALDLMNSTVRAGLSSSNTNALDTSLDYLRNGGGTDTDQYAMMGITDFWDENEYRYSRPRISTEYISATGGAESGGYGAAKYGAYYNFCAASAGSYCYGNATTGYGSSSGNAKEDICPKGWRIPTADSSGEYKALYEAYGSDYVDFVNALRIPLSGYYYNNRASNQGFSGPFWSSTWRNMGAVYRLYVTETYVDPQNGSNRHYGNAVRCIADTTSPYIITYSKNTADEVGDMPVSQSGTANSVRKPILSNNTPTREHYNFLGWCDTQPTSSNGIDSCGGTTYASGSEYTVSPGTPSITLYAMWRIESFTCYKQYRLQRADGTWGYYTTEATETVNYGGSCSYSKSITGYKDAANGVNDAEASVTVTNVTRDTNLYLDFYRNTYELTVSAGANTSGATGSGTYRWGQTVAVGVTKATDVTCTAYAAPTWTATAGTAPAAGASSSYTMPSSNATVTAISAANSVVQTVTLSRTNGASGIVIDGVNQTGSSVGLYCGNHTISGSYTSGYEFDSWSRANNVTVASTSSASTTMTVSGAGTLTLNGKSSKLFFQNATSAQCGQTIYDNRGTDAYKNIAYTTASINGLCWMTRNLDLPGGTTLSADDSNVTSNYTLPDSSPDGFSDDTTAYVYNSNSTTCEGGSPCYSYYSYVAATAGTNPSSGEAASDICPKGWRLPTQAELTALKNTYTTATALTAAPFNGVYAGFYIGGRFDAYGLRGVYWSSTAANVSSTVPNASYACSLYLNNLNSLDSATTGSQYKRYGGSVRCVAK